jgi:periplasmic protein TonB
MKHARSFLTLAVALISALALLLSATAVSAQDPPEKTSATVYRPGHGVKAPKPWYTPEPAYTDKARREKISGSVTLRVVVTAEGKVGDVRVLKSLDESLDKQAISTVRTWKFVAGTKDGKPVAVEIAIEVAFLLYR